MMLMTLDSRRRMGSHYGREYCNGSDKCGEVLFRIIIVIVRLNAAPVPELF